MLICDLCLGKSMDFRGRDRDERGEKMVAGSCGVGWQVRVRAES